MDCSTQTVSVRSSRPADCESLASFRDGARPAFSHERDALMPLADALPTDTNARSLAELSLSPHFARHWPSVYQSLQRAPLNRKALQEGSLGKNIKLLLWILK